MESNNMQSAICPECGAEVPANAGYISWCARCNWNLQPHQPSQPRTLMGGLYADLGKRFGRTLFDDLQCAPSLAPRMTASLALAAAFAITIHAVTLLCLIGGFWLIVTTWLSPV